MEKIKRLKQILAFQAESYDTIAQHELAYDALELITPPIDISISIDKNENIYLTKGEAKLYPCIIAHLDQVHQFEKNFKIIENTGNLLAVNSKSQVGIGGDDKVGVWIAIELLISLPAVKILFCVDEEIGCLGSMEINKSFFDDVSFMLQADRAGNSDIITHTNGIDICTDGFVRKVLKLKNAKKYSKTFGSVTDVGEIVPQVNLCGLNVSCGYYFAHTSKEIVNIRDALKTLTLFKEICRNLNYRRWKFTPKIKSYPKYTGWDSYAKYKGIHKKTRFFDIEKYKGSESFYCRTCGYLFQQCTCNYM